MKINKIFFLILILIFSLSVKIQAQSVMLYKANALYDTMAYAEAIPKFIKVLKKDSANADAMIKLADCYRKLNDVHKAAQTYKVIINKGLGKPILKLYYAQALMASSEYEDAKKYMAEYNADSRGETFKKAMDEMNTFFKDSACYTIEYLPFNSSLNDFSPRLLGDKIIFTSSREHSSVVNYINAWTDNNYFNLYYTQKKNNEKYTRVRHFVHSLDNRFNAGVVSFNRQSNIVYLTRNNIVDSKLVRAKDGQVKLQIYAATMNKKGTSYQYLLDFKYNNKEYNFMHPAISDDGLRLYFVSDIPGGIGGDDLWMCSKENDTWSAPKNLGKDINTEGDEVFPYIKGNVLYFSSNGLPGIGGLDLYKVILDDKGMPSGKPENMGIPLNSPGDDFGIVFNEEGNKGYFSSNRKALNIDDNIYGFTYKVPEKREIKIAGIITKNLTDTILPGTKVELIDNNNNIIGTDTTDEGGNYSFIVEPNQQYTVKGTKEHYLALVKQINTSTKEKNKIFSVDMNLDKNPKIIKHKLNELNVTTTENVIAKDTNRFVIMNQKLDSAGFKDYYARVQIGAFYKLTVEDFKKAYPSLKSKSIIIESVITDKGKTLHKFLLEQKYATINEAAKVQQEMWTVHKITDAFVAIYNMENERIAIYNTIKGEFVILKEGQKPIFF